MAKNRISRYFKYRELPTNCPKCGYTRWKTVEKGKKYQCRQCKHIRENK